MGVVFDDSGAGGGAAGAGKGKGGLEIGKEGEGEEDADGNHSGPPKSSPAVDGNPIIVLHQTRGEDLHQA